MRHVSGIAMTDITLSPASSSTASPADYLASIVLFAGLLLSIPVSAHAADAQAAGPILPATFTITCGPGDFWHRPTIMLVLPGGDVARMSFEEERFKGIHTGSVIDFTAAPPVPGGGLADGAGLFHCDATERCGTSAGKLIISEYAPGKEMTGNLTYDDGMGGATLTFKTAIWLTDEPSCM